MFPRTSSSLLFDRDSSCAGVRSRLRRSTFLAVLLGTAAFVPLARAQNAQYGSSPYLLGTAQINAITAQINAAVAQISITDELNYLGPTNATALPQFNLPMVNEEDGFINVGSVSPAAVVYPSGPAMVATWNLALAAAHGKASALDAKYGGVQLVSGPALNMYRTPLGGREAEYFSGEDPILGATFGPALVEGMQSQGVMTTVKHLVAYDEETNRTNIDVHVDERTLRELYLVPFESTVKVAKPASMMCSFNALNGTPNCQNGPLETDILKTQWGFQGWVLSDYDAIKDGLLAALAGTDADSGGGVFMNATNLAPAVANGSLPKAVVDDKLRRELRQFREFGFNNGTLELGNAVEPDNAYSEAVATQIEREGIVLLKNDNQALPLHKGKVSSIAVLGAFVNTAPPFSFGSGYANFRHYTTELQAIQAAVGSGATVDFVKECSLDPTLTPSVSGWTGTYYSSQNFAGAPSVTRTDALINFDWTRNAEPGTSSLGSTVWTGQITPTISGDHAFRIRGSGAMTVTVNGQLVVSNGTGAPIGNGFYDNAAVSGKIALVAGQTYDVRVTYSRVGGYIGYLGALDGAQFSWASLTPPERIRSYDAAIVSAGYGTAYEGESLDHGFELPEFEAELIANTTTVNPHTTAVVYANSGVDMRPFVDKVKGLIYAWYPGQNGATALAEVLLGVTNPSGKLPITLDRTLEENPSYAAKAFPLPINNMTVTDVTYAEGLFTGYRGYEKAGKQPLFPFGYGLSYTKFTYSGMSVSPGNVAGQPTVDVSFVVTNSGDVAGAETAQVYVGSGNPAFPGTIKELKGFEKEVLQPNTSRRYLVHLNARAFAHWDIAKGAWTVAPGSYSIVVGASSQDVRLRGAVSMGPATLSVTDSVPVIVPDFTHLN